MDDLTPLSEAVEESSSPVVPVAVGASALALAATACSGGGSGGGTVTPTPTPTPFTPLMSKASASRFLGQATMGATSVDILSVQTSGYAAWIDAEFAKPRAISHWDWLVTKGYNAAANIDNQAGFDATMWRQMIGAGDQLRQRVAMALLEILVVGIDGIQLNWQQFAMAAYVDMLCDNAFGNFRTVLDKMVTNAAMGSFMAVIGNRKADPATGATPDEHFGRELMQMFTLSAWLIDSNGFPQLSSPSFTAADVSGLARVFTGLTLDSTDASTPDRYRRPLVMDESLHEAGASTFLGATVPAGTPGMQAIKIALDTVFAHANTPLFIGKRLIQRLVKGSPTPAYVKRVAAIFVDNGSGVRGDLKAVVRTILLDKEARTDPVLKDETGYDIANGKVREPMLRLTNWARATSAFSASDAWGIGDTSSQETGLGQSPGRSPTVYNFFRLNYKVPEVEPYIGGLYAPELHTTNEKSVIGYVNFMQRAVNNALGDVKSDYTELLALANDSQALVDQVNALLAAGQLGTTTAATIKGAVDGATGSDNRVKIALLLTLAAPEYLAVK